MLPGLATAMMQGTADAVSGFAVSVFPASASKTFSSIDGLSHSGTTLPVTASPAGGSGSYTYAWTLVEGDVSISATSPATASTAFTALLPPETIVHATFRCTVTDTVTGAQRTADVSVTLHHVSLA